MDLVHEIGNVLHVPMLLVASELGRGAEEQALHCPQRALADTCRQP
jgi:hypothetical protein